jgi:hypothetical protein
VISGEWLEKRFVIVLCWSLAGCVHWTTLGVAGDSWLGASVDDFMVIAGPPYREFALQDGRIVYSWRKACQISITARNGLIQSWHSENCASIQPVPPEWKREKKIG